MKIATWNVNSGSIGDRLSELRSEYSTDIVAMQESAEPIDGSKTCLWAGDLKHKGVSLSSTLPNELAQFDGESSPSVACRFADSELGAFNVLALWAKPTPSYYADLLRTIELHRTFIRERPTIVMGDFNMSVRVHSKGKQFYLLNGLLNHDFDLHSAYHEHTNERFGMETMTTLYHKWGSAGCFHCDFVYVPSAWIPRLRSVTIPGYSKFTTSDHRPVVCDFR
ncbi:Endonuclease/Exonuclease/phosphatase family protein [Rubripirellula tenax]|uniref:Endonuclease/Exonuclease/phosphatase family protein n=1 Tax=Rubripirellula tenax TaxID=2528015 RepID=A0A5C6EKC2_9BACT|nr:endonuclease/exonuclease/phosphatase family protein [Rubripirellula tenax]TWU48905.1 Endonuclease/Exonuclease/phosphatase family protein [Rubripirellula tenax]